MLKAYNRMVFKDIFNRKQVADLREQVKNLQGIVEQRQESYYFWPQLYSPILNLPYTGEKTPGEMGAAKDYNLWYDYLRVRSWQSFLESEVTLIIFNKFTKWVIGTGLYVQSEPEKIVLRQEGINSIPDDFAKEVEHRFNLWITTRQSDTAGMMPFAEMSFEAYKNCIIGGDVLAINYPEGNSVKVQLIDGSHVVSPSADSGFLKAAQDRGNRIEYGVEIGQNNEHIAYYVLGSNGKYYRIERIGKRSGKLMAYLIYGSRYRLDNVRGYPLIASVLEKLKKLDRYAEATVGSAEERQKIAYSIEHNSDSTGENPLSAKIAQSKALGMQSALESKSVNEYEAAATKVAATTQKQAINMPIGATLKLLESKNELYFKDFYTTNIQLVCAAVELPYEVAMAMYNSNYSASRAAIKEWEHTLKVNRQKFAEHFYQPTYAIWLEMQILSGKIDAPGYIKAMNERNFMAIEAYCSARWLGANVPHIDPLKEVMAERLKLADDTTPLTDYDQSTESLGTGDFSQIIEKFKSQTELIKSMIGEQTKKQQVSPNQIMKDIMNNLIIENESIK